jgi:hypothetical protein
MQLRKPDGYWTLERCQAEALKYDTRNAFSKQKPSSAYLIAQRNGWLDQICGHMIGKRKPNGYWTLARCQEEALKYDTRKTFSNRANSAYLIAQRNGWLDQICGHMEEKKKPNGYWTLERCQADALKYDTGPELRRASPGTYRALHRYGWLDICFKHREAVIKPKGYWTLERCQAEALKYKTRKDFERGNRPASNAAAKRNWLDQICSHMTDGSPSDGNCFYLWLVVGAFFNGLPVYKFGVTSVRLHLKRIEEVARAGGFEYDLILWAPVGDAFAIEREVKAMGASPQYTGFNGCTEFRALADHEVSRIKAMALSEFVL